MLTLGSLALAGVWRVTAEPSRCVAVADHGGAEVTLTLYRPDDDAPLQLLQPPSPDRILLWRADLPPVSADHGLRWRVGLMSHPSTDPFGVPTVVGDRGLSLLLRVDVEPLLAALTTREPLEILHGDAPLAVVPSRRLGARLRRCLDAEP